MRLNPYNLTEIGPGFGWGSRAIEVIGQTVAIVVVLPLQILYWGLSKILERILP